MEYDILIKSATVLAPPPNEIISNPFVRRKLVEQLVDIGIFQGKIQALGPALKIQAKEVFDLKGLHVLPGIIDTQVHFREPGMSHKEDIESGSRAALLGGVTGFFEMPNTNPPTTTAAHHSEKIKLATNRSHVHFAFYLGASHDNLADIKQAAKLPNCPGIKIFMGSSTGSLLVSKPELLEEIVKICPLPMAVHCEDEERLLSRVSIATEGQHVLMHPRWRDPECSLMATKKIMSLIKKHGKQVHLLHLSSKEELNFLKSEKDLFSDTEKSKKSIQAGASFTTELLPNHLSFYSPDCYEKLGTKIQQNPPVREKIHFDRLWRAIEEGLIDVIGSDHAPHTLEEKARPYPSSPSGTPGVQTLLPVMLNHFQKKRLPLNKLVSMLTENPKCIFKIQNKGRIHVGADADLTVVDLNLEKKVETSWLASKSNWSPFEGETLKGWPRMVFLDGKLVMSDDKIIKPHQGRGFVFDHSTK